MYTITALREHVRDPLTGAIIPVGTSVNREVLLPPDHSLQRMGDVSIAEVAAKAAKEGK